MVTISHIYNTESGLDARVKINTAFDALYSMESGGLIEITYSDAQTAISGLLLSVGSYYKITDRADGGIILLAVSTNQFSLEGKGIFLNPDFQLVGQWELNWRTTGDIVGIWVAADEGSFGNGSIVFWNGYHYLVIDDGSFDGSDPATNTTSYQVLTKSVANGYIKEVDFILYDFDNDSVIKREDKRNNSVNGVAKFQWGNDNVYNNTFLSNAGKDIENQRGEFYGNTIADSGYITATNEFTGVFNYNLVGKSTWSVESNIDITKCTLNQFHSGVTTLAFTAEGKTIDNLGSNFEANLDIATAFAAGTLTIPNTLNYIGIFRLVNSAGETIDKIENLPTNHITRFYPTRGATQLFSHTAIGVAVADELVSDAAAINTITGRAHGSDFIEYENEGNLNRRYNAVILA